jgi:beta-phosphoglucomutase-like phosphatase (HAD superfamily)
MATTGISPRPRIEAVIFDLDGTLLDTETLSAQCIHSIVSKWGKEFTWEVNKLTLGKRGDLWPGLVIGALNLEGLLSPEQLHHDWEDLMASHSEGIEKLPGAQVLVEELYRRGIPMGIATSSSSATVEKKKRNHRDMFDKMSIVVCGDDSEVGLIAD